MKASLIFFVIIFSFTTVLISQENAELIVKDSLSASSSREMTADSSAETKADSSIKSQKLANSDSEKVDPEPTPIWIWILYFVFGASGFGMLINKRPAGYVVFAIIVYFVVKDFIVALDMDYPIWPFIALIIWILLTGGIAKKSNREVLEKEPWLKGDDK